MVDDANALLTAAGIEFSDLRPFIDGQQHRLFSFVNGAGRHRVLKIAKPGPLGDPLDPERTHVDGHRAELEAIRRVNRVGVPVPAHIISQDPAAMVLAHIPGESGQLLWDKQRLNEDGLRSVCHAMGRALAAIHSVRKPRDVDSAIPNLPGGPHGRPRLLHMDYHLGNVQLGRNRVSGWQVNGVIDWVVCRWGPCEADVVEMTMSVFHHVEGTESAFVAGYRAAGGVPLRLALVNGFVHAELVRQLGEGIEDARLRDRWEVWERELRPKV